MPSMTNRVACRSLSVPRISVEQRRPGPPLAERRVAADVVDPLGDQLGLEELERRQVAEHLGVRLDQQRHVDAPAAGRGDVVEAELVAQDRLAAARAGPGRCTCRP